MALQRTFGWSRVLATGAPVPNATITVFDQGTLNLSTIFADILLTPKANPFTADANGYWFFYAVNGRYDLQLSGGPGNWTEGDVEVASFVSLNGLTSDTQLFATGTAGVDFNIASAASTHTFNIPDAGLAARGVVTTGAQSFAGAKTFQTPIALGSGGTGISTAPAAGQLLIGTAGGLWTVAGLTGTPNQVTVTPGSGSITLSGPQNLHAGASPTFAGLTLSGLTANSFLYSGAAGLLTTTAAPTDGQILVGQTGAAPVLGTLAGAGGTTVTFAGNTWTISTPVAVGITSLNGLAVATQTFATGTTGSDFAIASIGAVHTFNIPDASASARGLVTVGSQTFGGGKTFQAAPTFSAGIGPQTSFTAGTGTQAARLSGVILSDFATYNTSGAGETTFSSIPIPANTLAVNGQAIRVTAFGQTANNANGKTFRIYFGATPVAPTFTASQPNNWVVSVLLVRTAAGAQYMICENKCFSVNAGTMAFTILNPVTPAENLAGAVTLRSTGQGGANNDITQTLFLVEIVG